METAKKEFFADYSLLCRKYAIMKKNNQEAEIWWSKNWMGM